MKPISYVGASAFAVFAILMLIGAAACSKSPEKGSREVVHSYYGNKDEYRSVSEKKTVRGFEVEICSDQCDLFVFRSDSPVAWDAIALFKATLTGVAIDETFYRENQGLIDRLLDRHVSAACSKESGTEARGRCAISDIMKSTEISYAHVRYDEGYRCESFWTISSDPREISSKCVEWTPEK